MKFRYLIGALLIGLGIVSACTEEELQTLSELQVSESYVSLEVGGSTSSITVTAIENWSVVAESVPEWLTVSPMSGAAGETKLSFTAEATTATRSAEVKLLCNAKNQFINVIQYAEKVEPKLSTIAEVIAGADGDYFRVKGVCSRYDTGNANAVLYGNWYISDDTGTIYIYGTLNKAGQTKGNPLTDWGIEVGDVVTIEGPKTTYGTTVELVDVTVLAVEKSLIGIDSVELLGAEEGEGVTEFPLEGGSIKVSLSVKGDGFRVIIPDEAKSWLHIEDFDSSSVTLKADKNDGGDRSVEVTFSTEKDGKTYTCVQAFTQKGAILEVSIAEFLAAEVGDTQYRLTGVITSEYASDKQGQSFYIKDWSGEVLVYRLNDYKASGAKVDDIITVVGKRGAYGETKQMVSGVYQTHIPVTTVTIAEFITKPDDKPSDTNVGTYYKVTGTITSLKNNKGQDNDYGNLYISDGTNEIYLYGLYPGWGATGDARKGFVKAQGIEVGDVLTSIGYKDTYSGLIELCGGIYVSHEKGQTPPDPTDPFDYTPSAEYSASTNLWKPVDDAKATKFFYYNATNDQWDGTETEATLDDIGFVTLKQSTYKVVYDVATTSDGNTNPWRNQIFLYPAAGHEVALSADKTYNLKITVHTTAATLSFFKFSKFNPAAPKKYEGDCIWEFGQKVLADGEDLVIEKEGITGVACDNINLIFAFGGHAANTTVYIKDITLVEVGAEPVDNSKTVTEAIALADATAVELKESLVVALTTKGAVLSDGTSAVYAYGSAAAALAVGDKVTLKANKTTFNGVPELESLTDVTKVSGGNDVTYPTAKDITAEAATYSAAVAEFVSITGTLSVSSDNKYYNLTLDGIDSNTKQGSIVYPVDALNAKSFDGKKITVTGYFNGLSSKGKFVNVIATKIEEASDGIKMDGVMSDWDGIEAIPNDGTILEWKYAYDAKNIYFYYKIDSSDIKDKDGSYNWRRYIFVGLDTDNNPATGMTEGMPAGLKLTGLEAIASVYPFRGNVPDGQTYPEGVEFVNGADEQGDIECPAGTVSGKKVVAYGYRDGAVAYLEIAISREAIGNPAAGTYNVQHSFSWNLTEAKAITIE